MVKDLYLNVMMVMIRMEMAVHSIARLKLVSFAGVVLLTK